MKRIHLLIITSFVIIYFAFLYWYYKPAPPISSDEIENYVILFQQQMDETDRISLEELTQMTSFMKNDDGKAFYNINIVKYRKQALYSYDINLDGTGEEANDRYSQFMLKEVLSRACHPVTVLKPTIKLMGEDYGGGQPYWDDISIIRYRSRRDFMDVITSEGFKNGNVHKWAGVEDTLVYPAQGISLAIVPILVLFILSILALIFFGLSQYFYKKKRIGILTARLVIFLLAFIHLILPYTPVNQHEGSQIPIGAGIIGVCFSVLAWKSYKNPRKYFIFALAFFWGVTLLAAITGASPIMEGYGVKIVFSLGLLWGIWQSKKLKRNLKTNT